MNRSQEFCIANNMAIFCGFDCLEIIYLHTRDFRNPILVSFVVIFYFELEMSIISVLHDPIAGILNGLDIEF